MREPEREEGALVQSYNSPDPKLEAWISPRGARKCLKGFLCTPSKGIAGAALIPYMSLTETNEAMSIAIINGHNGRT